MAVGKRTEALKRGGTEETEKGEITNNAEIAKQSKLIECHCRQQLSFTPLLPPLLCVSKVYRLFRFRHKLSRLNLPCSLYLHKDSIITSLGKAIREGNFCGRCGMVHVFHP